MEKQLQEISHGLRTYVKEGQTTFLIVAILVVLLICFVFLYRRMSVLLVARGEIERLFAALAEGCGLTTYEEDLLLDMADTFSLRNPSILFVSPSLVERYASHPEASRKYPDPVQLQAQVRTLAEKLFGK